MIAVSALLNWFSVFCFGFRVSCDRFEKSRYLEGK